MSRSGLIAFMEEQIRAGFASPHEIVENSYQWAQEQESELVSLQEIKRITADLIADQISEQATWEGPTDCDRLDEAFAALNRQRIVARQNFSCCNNCGFTEIWDEVEEAEKQGQVIGYVFYHLQCTERAILTGQLLIAFGSVEEDRAAFEHTANTAVFELNCAGLTASWGGTDRHPIVIDNIVWRRRAAAGLP